MMSVNGDQFGDPCPGTSKYLLVTYKCRTAPAGLFIHPVNSDLAIPSCACIN